MADEIAIEVTADGSRFDREIRRILSRHNNDTVTISVDVNTRDAQAQIRNARRQFASEGRSAGAGFSDGFRKGSRGLNFDLPDLSGLARVGSLGAGFATVGASAASAAAGVTQFVAALAPSVGILAAVPAATGIAAAGIATLNVALSGVSDAFGAALGDDAQKFQDSLSGLAPEAAATAVALRDLKPEFDALRESVQGAFFEGLDQALSDVAGTLIGPLTEGMTGAAGAINEFIVGLSDIASSAEGVQFVEQSFSGLQTIIENLTGPVLNLAESLLNVGNAVGEAFSGEQLGSGLADMIDRFAQFLDQAASSGQAVEWVQGAITVFQQLGAILSPIAGILGSIGEAASASGENVLGVFGTLLQGVDDFLNSVQGVDFLGELFNVLGSLGDAVLPILTAIGTAIAGIAPSIADTVTALGPGIETLVGALGEGLAALAPALVPLADALVSIVEAASPLLPVLGELIGVLVEAGAGIISALSPLITVATELINSILQPLIPFIEEWAEIFTSALAPAIQQVADIFAQLGPYWTEIIEMLSGALLPLFERWATEVLPELLPPLLELIGVLVETLIPVMEELLPVFGELIESIGGAFIDAVVAIIPLVVSFVEQLAAILEILAPIITASAHLTALIMGDMIDAFSEMIGWVTSAIGWFADLLSGIVDFGTDALSSLQEFVDGVASKFESIGDWIDTVVDWFRNLPGRILDAIGDIGSKIGEAFEGFNISGILPSFANGGVVTSRTIAEIGEAGREVVIPLTRRSRAVQLAEQSGLTQILDDNRTADQRGEINVTVNNYSSDPMIVQRTVERVLADAL